jgi:hypothetical protein
MRIVLRRSDRKRYEFQIYSATRARYLLYRTSRANRIRRETRRSPAAKLLATEKNLSIQPFKWSFPMKRTLTLTALFVLTSASAAYAAAPGAANGMLKACCDAIAACCDAPCCDK